MQRRKSGRLRLLLDLDARGPKYFSMNTRVPLHLVANDTAVVFYLPNSV